MHNHLLNPGRSRLSACLRLLAVAAALCVAAESQASGWPPFAINDNATVEQGGTVTVLDGGANNVLANDFDFEKDRLEAYLVKAPKYGQVNLNPGGTFSYTHDGGDKKKDDFEYVAWDGTSVSRRRAKVDIVIEKSEPVVPIAPIITGQNPVNVAEDSSIQIVLGFLRVQDPDSSYPDDFTLEVANGANYARNGATITPAKNYFGPLTVPVRVHDGTYNSQWFDLDVDVNSRNDAPVATGSPPAQEAIENTAYSLDTAGYFSDIDPGDSLRFSVRGLPNGNNLGINAGTGRLSGTPRAVDVSNNPYPVEVIATDEGGLTASITFPLMIFADDRVDLAVSVKLSANPIVVAETAEWVIDIENLGPADLDDPAELTGNWTTSGANLTLTAPQGCTVGNNGSSAPNVSCAVNAMLAGSTTSVVIQGSIDRDGDNTMFAVAIADDPVPSNNIAAASGHVVAEFSEGASQILGFSAADIAAADFDNDGALDFVATKDETVVFFNSGNRNFNESGMSLGPASGGSHIVSLDWNGDGWMDIAVANLAEISTAIWLNDGSGGFAQQLAVADAGIGNINDMAAADFDQDGLSELGMTGVSGSVILRSTGPNEFGFTAVSSEAGISMVAGDLDQNTYPDIVIVNAADRVVGLYHNSGDGRTFASSSLNYGSVAHVALADMDQDSNVDLLLSTDGQDLSAPHNIVVYQVPGNGFTAGEPVGASVVEALLAGDIDGDGVTDLAAVNGAGVHQTYRPDQAGSFTLNPQQIVSAEMRRGVLADFNNDDSLDLLLAGSLATAIEFHANNGIGHLGRGDRVAPELSVLGETVISIPAGTDYVDQGATALDDIEGDVTNRIQTSGSVNTSSPGNYTITYTVADKATNTATASRSVTVGVNSGTGGSGGGALSLLLLFLMLATTLHLRTRRPSRKCCNTSNAIH